MPRRTDFLIIGSGIAGLRAAADLALAGDVLVLTKADPTESNTGYAQGGIAAAVAPGDSPGATRRRHHRRRRRPLRRGRGRRAGRRRRALRARTDRVGRAVRSRSTPARWRSGREGAHGLRRVLHAADATGREIGRALWERVAEQARVRVERNARAVELIVEGGRCIGARFITNDVGSTRSMRARCCWRPAARARCFSETTNPPIATGDGVMLAWFAGARVADLEFVQFHPTALDVAGRAAIPAVGSAARRRRAAAERRAASGS